jgi:hypothetical protein
LKNGVPFRLAFGREPQFLLPEEQAAMAIIFSEIEGGGDFDWNAMRWNERGN